MRYQVRRRLKYIVLCVGVVVAGYAIVMIAAYGHVRLTELDVNSGRVRTTHYLGGVRISRREIKDTDFSRLVSRLGIETRPAEWVPVWERQYLFSKGGTNDYRAGKLCGAAKAAVLYFEIAKLSEDSQRPVVNELLEWMREGDIERAVQWEKDINDSLKSENSE